MYSPTKSPFTQWWDTNMQQIAVSPAVRELIAMAFEGGMQAEKSWVGLTDEELRDVWLDTHRKTDATDAFARAIEAKLKEKNK